MPNNEMPQAVNSRSSALTWYGVTAFASALETTTLHSLDTSTKRIQNNPHPFYSWRLSPAANLASMRQVLFKDAADKNIFYKFASLYRGYPQALGYKFLQRGALALQPHLKKAMEAHFQTQSYGIDLASGILIGGGEALFLLPIDYYKTRAQTREVEATKNTKSSFTAFGPTLARNILFVTTMSVATDGALSYLVKNNILTTHTDSKKTEPSEAQKHAARAFGFGAATFSSSPLDVIKTRLQALPVKSSKTAWQLGSDIFSKEGPAAFLKGVLPKTLTQSFRLTFFFGVQEALLKRVLPAETKDAAPKPKMP